MQQQLYVGMYRFYIHWSVWFLMAQRYDVFAYFQIFMHKSNTNSRDSPQAG